MLVFLAYVIFGTSCAENRMPATVQQGHSSVKEVERINLKTRVFKVYQVSKQCTISFPKESMISQIELYLDTFQTNIDSSKHSEYSIRMYQKYNSMKQVLLDNDYYKIVNSTDIDSLQEMSVIDKIEVLETDPNLGFGLYAQDIMCNLLMEGEAGVKINGTILSVILMKKIKESSDFSGSSSTVFTTEQGVPIFQCRPDFHFHK